MPEQTDPDAIEREIERTRVELAETIDAIADKVSPKRAFSRTAGKVKARVNGDTRPRLRVGIPERGTSQTFVADNQPDLAPTTAADRHEANARPTGAPGGPASIYTVRRSLRVDRVLMVVGGVVGVAVVVVLIRRRRAG